MRKLAAFAALCLLTAAKDEPQGDWVGDPRTIPEVVLSAYALDGEIAVSGGAFDGLTWASEGREPGATWPWASVTKQLLATVVMQEVEAGRLDLDTPVSQWLADWPEGGPPAPSLRQLLRHQSGLYDPEDDPAFDWTGAKPLDPMLCVARRTRAPGGDFDYTNCDTLLAARVLERTTGHDMAALMRKRLVEPAGMGAAGFVTPAMRLATGVDADQPQDIADYGAAGGFSGTARNLLAFDRALMEGRLLGEAARAEMWRGDPQLGYTALAQWEATLPLYGCEAPVRIIERRGAIGGYQARNFILPERGISLVVFAGKSEADYAFGEVWSGEGLSYDLLSAVACRKAS